MKTVGVTDYTNQTPSTHFGRKKCLSSTPSKLRKYSYSVQKVRGAHLQCVNNHYTKFENKGTKTFEFKLQITQSKAPQKCCGRTDRWSGPTTRPVVFRQGDAEKSDTYGLGGDLYNFKDTKLYVKGMRGHTAITVNAITRSVFIQYCLFVYNPEARC